MGLSSDLDSLWAGSPHNVVEDLDEGLFSGTIAGHGVVSPELASAIVQGGLFRCMESAFDTPVISLSIPVAFSGGGFLDQVPLPHLLVLRLMRRLCLRRFCPLRKTFQWSSCH